MRIYIAGPMRGYPGFNFDAFDKAADLIRSVGHKPVSPAEIDRLIDGFSGVGDPPDLEDCIERDLLAIRSVDAVYSLRGWKHSLGAGSEVMLARWRGIPIAFENRNENSLCVRIPCDHKLQRVLDYARTA